MSGALLAGCAQPTLTGTTFSRDEARQVQTVQMGYVESVTPVVIEGRTDGFVGAGTGAAVGGILDRGIGGGRGRVSPSGSWARVRRRASRVDYNR